MKKHLFLIILLFGSVSCFSQSDSMVYDTAGNPMFYQKQIIVKFHPELMKTQTINDLEIQETRLDSFIKDSVLDMISDSGFFYTDLGSLRAHRIFRNLKTTDTLSITRLGDTVRIEEFWSTLLIEWPGAPPRNLDILNLCDTLNKYPRVIMYAQPNFIYETTALPNDNLFTNDFHPNLTNTLSFNNNQHVNVVPAWDNETGKDNIRVAIFDTGVRWSHNDFSSDNTFGNSQVKGGWDFINGRLISYTNLNDDVNHGTRCAGIFGAKRNNSVGVSGIAGGNNDVNNKGVSIYAFKCMEPANGGGGRGNTADFVAAINDAALWITTPTPKGYGVHVMNNSWVNVKNLWESLLSWGYTFDKALSDQVRFANTMNVVFVAARGNENNDKITYPACYKDEWVISVGASNEVPTRASFSSYGQNMDLVAPGTGELVSTTDNTTDGTYTIIQSTDPIYKFSGTSASCPHVVGAAALLLSHVNSPSPSNNLAPEDVEQLLQTYASDLGSSGYDAQTGFGLLNIDNALDHILMPKYKIWHYKMTVPANHAWLSASNQTITLTSAYGGLAAGTYTGVNVWKIYAINPHWTPSSWTLLGGWVRISSCTGTWGAPGVVSPVCHADKITIDHDYGKIEGYIYDFTNAYNTVAQKVGSPDMWFPQKLTGTVTFAYSVHTYDASATSADLPSLNNLKVYVSPNPTDNDFNLSVNRDIQINAVRIFNSVGIQVAVPFNRINFIAGDSYNVNVADLPAGVYICSIDTPAGVINKKIVCK